MNDTKNDSLQKAINYLGAVEVAPGRYTFRIAGQQWFVSTTNALEYYSAGRYAEGERLEYLQARSETARMPAWWSPEQRFAWRNKQTLGLTTEAPTYCRNLFERITASLEDGSEVPA